MDANNLVDVSEVRVRIRSETLHRTQHIFIIPSLYFTSKQEQDTFVLHRVDEITGTVLWPMSWPVSLLAIPNIEYLQDSVSTSV